MTDLFNSNFEVSLRLLLLLSVMGQDGITIDRAAAYDFISIYSSDFQLGSINLHGNNHFGFSEFSNRRTCTKEALKALVLDGLVLVHNSFDGFRYLISEAGKGVCSAFHTDYAAKYRELSLLTRRHFDSMTDEAVLKSISKQAMLDLKGGDRN